MSSNASSCLWALQEECIPEIMTLRARHARGEDLQPMDVKVLQARSRSAVPTSGQAAVIPIFGLLSRRMDWLTAFLGGSSMETLGRLVDVAANDDTIAHIVLLVDSPGGSVAGTSELAAKVRAARDRKPVTAVVDSMAASAAYWIASQAGTVYASPSAMVGSIGVYVAHMDVSSMYEQIGVKVTLVSNEASPHKVEGNPYEALPEAARADLQQKVNSIAGQFVAEVAKGRRTTEKKILDHYGKGRVLLAQEALSAGMVDGIRTIDDVLSELRQGGQTPTVAAAGEGGSLSAHPATVRARAIEVTEEAERDHSRNRAPVAVQQKQPAPRQYEDSLAGRLAAARDRAAQVERDIFEEELADPALAWRRQHAPRRRVTNYDDEDATNRL